jgi:arylamine N-acetyltransferase
MTAISKELQTKILRRLEFNEPVSADIQTLQRLYSSWCMNMPFDNLRKMIALKSGNKQSLPGLDASDFFENWLENGCGATCWPMANALYELLISVGFDAQRIAGYMMDLGVINHGSLKVFINGKYYIVEAALLLNQILPLDGNSIINTDPLYPFELEKDEESYLLWLLSPVTNEFFYCRIICNPVGFPFFDERYEASRERSVFNQSLYARRNYQDKLIIIRGNTHFSMTVNGLEQRALSRDEVCLALRNDIGISDNLINECVSSGCLDASFEKPSDVPPPPVTLKPPSQR